MGQVTSGRSRTADPLGAEGQEALLAAARTGDETAFARLVRTASPVLVRTAAAVTGERGRADALVRATFLQALAELSAYRPPPGARAWLCALLLREARPDHEPPGAGPVVDADRFLPPGDPEWPGHWSLPPAAWPALDDARPQGVGEVLRRALTGLPGTERVVVALRDVAGCEVADIGLVVARPPDEVRALLNRGRAALRTELERHLAARSA